MTQVQIAGDKQVNSSAISQILATIRHMESGGNYTAQSPKASASGAYGIIDSTWKSWAAYVPGASQYTHAANAPAAIQDQVAGAAVQRILNTHDNWLSSVPINWYFPAAWNNPAIANDLPRDKNGNVIGGNTSTIKGYAQKWVNYFSAGKSDPTTNTDTSSQSTSVPYSSTTTPAPTDPTGTGHPYMVAGKYMITSAGEYIYNDLEGLMYIVRGNKRIPVTIDTGTDQVNIPIVTPIVDSIGSVVDFLQLLAQANTWIRVAKVTGGVLSIAIGLVVLTHAMGVPLPKVPTVTKAAETAAEVAV